VTSLVSPRRGSLTTPVGPITRSELIRLRDLRHRVDRCTRDRHLPEMDFSGIELTRQ
jgi:hypothetical protein